MSLLCAVQLSLLGAGVCHDLLLLPLPHCSLQLRVAEPVPAAVPAHPGAAAAFRTLTMQPTLCPLRSYVWLNQYQSQFLPILGLLLHAAFQTDCIALVSIVLAATCG